MSKIMKEKIDLLTKKTNKSMELNLGPVFRHMKLRDELNLLQRIVDANNISIGDYLPKNTRALFETMTLFEEKYMGKSLEESLYQELNELEKQKFPNEANDFMEGMVAFYTRIMNEFTIDSFLHGQSYGKPN